MRKNPMKSSWLRAILITSIIAAVSCTTRATRAAEVVLSDAKARLAFDSDTGAITTLEYQSPHWLVERRPELGVCFRMHVPLPKRRDNFVLGQRQRADYVKKISDHEVQLKWKDLQSEHGGKLPITFTADVTLNDGVLTFTSRLENQSDLTVESVEYPYFGDLNSPTRDTTMQFRAIGYSSLDADELYPVFVNQKGYWGVDSSMKTFDSCNGPFGIIEAGTQVLYAGFQDPTQPYYLTHTFEQLPGMISRQNYLIPKTDDISGHPVHTEYRFTHFLFAAPKSTKTTVPIVINHLAGDWHNGVDFYKQWRTTWFKQPRVPDWARDVHSWQQIQINSPEDEWRCKYKDLVKYGDECAAAGVKAIQLVGWNKGGQDGGDPAQDVDPELGTFQELHDAIAAIQAKGVEVILFGKLNFADTTTDWCKNQLCKLAATDPFGVPYWTAGYSYHTMTQLVGINNHRRLIMDYCAPAYQDIAVHEIEKVLKLGSAGWLFDEECAHDMAKYSFATDHGYTAPGYLYSADLPVVKRFHEAADKVNPNFLFAAESPADWMLQGYPFSYYRAGAGSTPIERYIDSKIPLMIAANGFDDRESINLCLLWRYVISYEPYNFKGHLSDFPLTLAYGQKIDALRRRYREYLWDGEFQDTVGATVAGEGLRYSVFKRADGKRAVVVTNLHFDQPVTATVQLPSPKTLTVVTPEDPDSKPTEGHVTIPARSAAVVLEQ